MRVGLDPFAGLHRDDPAVTLSLVAGTTGVHDVTILRTLGEAHNAHTRVRLVLRKNTPGDATVRVVEGYVAEISTGTDGKARVRMSVPMGGGEPIEVRIELASISMVQTVA